MMLINSDCNHLVHKLLSGTRYDVKSTDEERDPIRQQKQKKYENLRRQCREFHRRNENDSDSKLTAQSSNTEESQVLDSHDIEQVNSSMRSIQVEEAEKLDSESTLQDGDCEKSGVTTEDDANDSDSTNSEETEAFNSEETEVLPHVAKEVAAESYDRVNQIIT